MKGINKELDAKIKQEVMIKDAFNAAKETVNIQRPVTRRAIEDIHDLRELKLLEDDWMNA